LKDLVEAVTIPGKTDKLVISIDQKPFQEFPRLTYHKNLEREVMHFLDGLYITLLNYARLDLSIDENLFTEGRFKTYFHEHVVQNSDGCTWDFDKMTHLSPLDSINADLIKYAFKPDRYGHGAENLEAVGLDPNWRSKHGFLNADESTVEGLSNAAMTVHTYRSNSSSATALRNMHYARSSGTIGQEEMEESTLDGKTSPPASPDDGSDSSSNAQMRSPDHNQTPDSLYGTPRQHNSDPQLDSIIQNSNYSSPQRTQTNQAAGPPASTDTTDPRGVGQHP
jgi:hypothetical protein